MTHSFNAFSIYNSWGYHEPAPGLLDFEHGGHNFTSLMTIAEELGIYLLIRPGPYVNAEANAGGFPLWLTTGEYGELRDDDPRYTEAWSGYWEEISKIIVPHLVTNGGNVAMFQVREFVQFPFHVFNCGTDWNVKIENEHGYQWEDVEERILHEPVANYMQLLQDSARDAGIDVPVFHNSPNAVSATCDDFLLPHTS